MNDAIDPALRSRIVAAITSDEIAIQAAIRACRAMEAAQSAGAPFSVRWQCMRDLAHHVDVMWRTHSASQKYWCRLTTAQIERLEQELFEQELLGTEPETQP